MNRPLTVFILAAGHGERLSPITSYIPKPLLPVLGKPVLAHVLEKVTLLNPAHIGINLHHKKDIIEEWIVDSGYSEKVTVFPETAILGTGGALKNAESLLCQHTFLIHNSDVLSDIDLQKLISHHSASNNIATLAVHDHPKFSNLFVDQNGLLAGANEQPTSSDGEVKQAAFTGIAVYEPEFLNYLPSGASHVVDAWLMALSAGYKVGTFDVGGCSWIDIGTPSAYASAVFRALRNDGETIYIHHTVSGCHNVEMDGFVAMEKGCRLSPGIALKNCILLPGSSPQVNSSYENVIMGENYFVAFEEDEVLEAGGQDTGIVVGAGGSDREYLRIKDAGRTCIILSAGDEHQDFVRHVEYAGFFLKYGVPVPYLYRVDLQQMQAEFEDLGDLSLYSWLRCRRPLWQIEAMYKKVIDTAVLIHTDLTDHAAECPLLNERVFDYDYLCWETAYFVEYFAKGLRNVSAKDMTALDEEFRCLAQRVDTFAKTVIHRDLQAQNIMVTKSRTPRIIDYQGARIGPTAYDIVSLLWDPYYRLDSELRGALLAYYLDRMAVKTGGLFDRDIFIKTIPHCRLQRHMQVLGAYGFLSTVKGKRYFLKHVDEGLRLLQEDAELTRDEYPVLYELVKKLS